MVYILVKHRVKDFKKFRKAFFGNFKRVPKNGSKGGFIFRSKDDVFVLVKWHSLKNFQKFANSPKIPKDNLMKASVVGKPEGWIFEQFEKFNY